MNKQEIFDKVATHLITQNAKAVSEDDSESCLYRSPGGLTCAMGHLIPDDLYHPSMEGKGARAELFAPVYDHLDVPYVLGDESTLHGEEVRLIMALQSTHDNWPPDRWPDVLATVAKDYELNADCIEAAWAA